MPWGYHLVHMAKDWNITDKIRAVVHDNASNTKEISEKAKLPKSCDVPCAAHTLQLSIKKGTDIRLVSSLVGAANKLVAHFKRSSVATGALALKQRSFELKEHKLITSCPTIWNSIYDMMVRLNENPVGYRGSSRRQEMYKGRGLSTP